nr:asparagine synthase C-terminal domain-containing protein [Sphingomonas rhizophila]
MATDALSYLPDDILCKVDRAAMAVSLETRVPFLDHRVSAFAARLPLAMKIRGGEGKSLLRKLVARHLPSELFDRPKAGFAIPVGQWLRGPLKPWAEDLISPDSLRRSGHFDEKRVARAWALHQSGRRDLTPALWSVLMFQGWLGEQAR